MSNILITGATGLIGTHLLPLLRSAGHKLFVVSRDKSINAEDVEVIDLDLSDDWKLDSLPMKMDVVVHLAQSKNFREFPEKANDIFNVNVVSTMKLCQYALKAGVKSFVYASSAGIYGTCEDVPFKEDYEIVWNPNLGFYLSTKYNAEVILDSFKNFMNIVSLRYFFVYGKGQSSDMLIPRLVNNVKNNNTIKIAGKDGIKLSLTHASDAAIAIVNSLKLEGSHKLNVTGPDSLSLKEICDVIGEQLGISPNYEFDAPVANKNILGDNSLMRKILFEPSMNFSEGIKSLL